MAKTKKSDTVHIAQDQWFYSYDHMLFFMTVKCKGKGAQWLSGRVLDSRLRFRRVKPHWPHCVVSLGKNINPSLVQVPPRKTRPFITERLLMGHKESNQTNKNKMQRLVLLTL